jgi:hypothetical protein
MEKTCERCGSKGERITTGPFAGDYHMLDYCAECGKDLCPKCMAEGCCGNKPAESGMKADYPDDDR